ncbi:AAA family ATPase [Acerihabitans sp. TG2]|uniref:AAA family ATPase n=1 Tax=Acerihabitans sp. TG2 TaxID=3096008 RepID=UPI002B23B7FA|nr:AAA family ATPase [Acerihabitans sp. TG2]MEA9393508.1 AAA family ATPase [Acerihabitans sp. TG2]
MFFKILPPSKNAPLETDDDAIFYLKQDNWNDFSFYTLYHLYLSGKYSKDKSIYYIGPVKILKKGQTTSDGHLLKLGGMEYLSDDYCSVGQTLDYYERMASLDDDIIEKIRFSLRDINTIDNYLYEFGNERGWEQSIMRDIDDDDDIFTLSNHILNREYNMLPSVDLKIIFHYEGMIDPIIFDFNSNNSNSTNEYSLPSRMAIIIGRNGTGKSTLLAKISRVAFASTKDRNDGVFRKIGRIEPEGIGFPKIINISYSSFDSFQIPGIYFNEKEQIYKDLKNNTGRYIYCGMRDICEEIGGFLEGRSVGDETKLSDDDILSDRQNFTILKSIRTLASEFSTLMKGIYESKSKKDILFQVFLVLRKETSFEEIVDLFDNKFELDDFFEIFMRQSTGHKFVLHSLVNLIFHVEKRSLILFDEPETHLHPPLLSVLMSAIRLVLDIKDAFAIIATHSPVVVQETVSRQVNIIIRSGNMTKAISPGIQTYGENIGLITSHIFGLSSDITDFHSKLDEVIKLYSINNNKVVHKYEIMNKIEKLFSEEISMQARAYIMTKLSNKE